MQQDLVKAVVKGHEEDPLHRDVPGPYLCRKDLPVARDLPHKWGPKTTSTETCGV